MNNKEKELEIKIAQLESENVELRKSEQLLASRTALAWTGMVSATWRHNIEGIANNIINSVTLIRSRLKTNIDVDELNKRLQLIENMARKILDKPITPPLSSEDGVEIVNINELLKERISQLADDEFYKNVNIILKLDADSKVFVRTSPQWLTRAIDILIDNSVEAMLNSTQKNITIKTSLVNNQAEIIIEDNGSGISQDVQSSLFHNLIPKEKGEKGLGLGLLMARMIFQAYMGDIVLVKTDASGTVFKINLPQALK